MIVCLREQEVKYVLKVTCLGVRLKRSGLRLVNLIVNLIELRFIGH